MAKSVSTIQVLLVVCLTASGYRRAGMALTKGENHIPLAELSDEQVAAFKADKRLTVSVIDMVPAAGSVELSNGDPSLGADLTGTLTGTKDANGTEKSLDQLTAKELKELAKDMEITGVNSMNKTDLVSAIQAVTVTLPGANETASPSADAPSTATNAAGE
tara:strand:- start:6274 stop:6756 length:483 start_codon:yes stop_codon:yes gene_type:complete